jgi:hypothetical protein
MRSKQRPDTLMQDRSPPGRRNLLATHGRTRSFRRCWLVVRFTRSGRAGRFNEYTLGECIHYPVMRFFTFPQCLDRPAR